MAQETVGQLTPRELKEWQRVSSRKNALAAPGMRCTLDEAAEVLVDFYRVSTQLTHEHQPDVEEGDQVSISPFTGRMYINY